MKLSISSFLLAAGLLALIRCQSPVSQVAEPASRALATGVQVDVTIKALANGKYASVDGGAGNVLSAKAATAGTAETYTLVPVGTNFALKSKANGKFVCADNAGAAALVANRDTVQGWETFTLVSLGGDNYALKALANNRYVCADNAGASPLIANRDAAQGWETFSIVTVGGGPIDPPATGSLVVTYTKKDDWGNGYNGQITLKNTGTTAVTKWTVTFDAPAVAAVYNANWTQSGSKVTLTPKAGTAGASIAAGATVTDIIFTVYNSSTQPTNVSLGGSTPVDTVPAAPTGVAASASSSQVTLSWGTVGGATSYNVYWAAGASVSLAAGTKVSGVTSGWIHTGLTNGTTYSYLVTAVNAKGESAASAPSSATPTAVPPSTFSWNSPAIGSLINGSQANGTVTAQKSGAWDSLVPTVSGALVSNNTWGIPQNGNGQVSIFTGSVKGTPTFGWSWNLTATSANQVIAYPEIGWGWSPNSGAWFNGPVAIHKLSDGKQYTVDFNIVRTNRSGIWNTAFDIWIYPMTNPTGGSGGFKGGYELMIWLDHNVQGPWGSNPQNVSLAGSNWKAYDNDGSAGWRVLTYINQGAPINDARGFDLTAFLNDIVSRYNVPANNYINAIEFGSESCGGQGMLEVANYAIKIQ